MIKAPKDSNQGCGYWEHVLDLEDDDSLIVEHGYHDGPNYLYPRCPLCQKESGR